MQRNRSGRSFNQWVAGSNPARLTTFTSEYQKCRRHPIIGCLGVLAKKGSDLVSQTAAGGVQKILRRAFRLHAVAELIQLESFALAAGGEPRREPDCRGAYAVSSNHDDFLWQL